MHLVHHHPSEEEEFQEGREEAGVLSRCHERGEESDAGGSGSTRARVGDLDSLLLHREREKGGVGRAPQELSGAQDDVRLE